MGKELIDTGTSPRVKADCPFKHIDYLLSFFCRCHYLLPAVGEWTWTISDIVFDTGVRNEGHLLLAGFADGVNYLHQLVIVDIT